MTTHDVFVTGGTGYLGRPLIERLLHRGHRVRALARAQSIGKLPSGTHPVIGNALDASSFCEMVPPADTLLHLVGVPHPNPAKAKAFRAVDLASIQTSVDVATRSGIRHFVYVSVAHPAPVMRAYIAVRQEAESLIRQSGLNATLLRPWYVLGPGRWWPYALKPLYALFERLPTTHAAAQRLGLVTRTQMVMALVVALEDPPRGVRVLEVPEIRAASFKTAAP